MTYDALGIAGSGMSANRRWIDSVSDNIANLNNVTRTNEAAFQARYLEVAPMDNGGVTVTRALFGDAEGRTVYQPDHELADEDGNVRLPDIDLASQMTNLIMAQRAYQANAQVIERSKTTFESALQIGRN